jgi:peptidoglycan DL-endopeptidase CwlO
MTTTRHAKGFDTVTRPPVELEIFAPDGTVPPAACEAAVRTPTLGKPLIPTDRASGRRPGRRRLTALAIGLAIISIAPASVVGDPSSIRAKRAEVARIQSEVAAIDVKVAQAAEAYNGAQYELTQIQGRIRQNSRVLKGTAQQLKVAQSILAERLRRLYVTPEPSLVETVLVSGSISSAVDQMDLLQRSNEQDRVVVVGIRRNKRELEVARAQLATDKVASEKNVAARDAQRQEVAGLLRKREAVLSSAKGDLGRLIAQQQAAEKAAAAEAKRRALEAQQVSVAPSVPSSGAVAPVAAAGSGGGNAAAVSIAMQYLGVPYVWGGATPSGFDCSGLMTYVFAQLGKSVPHYTGAIYAAFPKVASGDLQPGDMVFFGSDLHHMGMYIGNGQMIHAPHTGDVVRIASIGDRSDYAGAVRA